MLISEIVEFFYMNVIYICVDFTTDIYILI
jgi:hypothetical protein